jgi:hypothetical protein
MSEPQGTDMDEQDQLRRAEPPRPRAVGSPLPMGNGGRAVVSPAQEEPKRIPAASGNAAPEERTFNSSSSAEEQAAEQPSSIQRAMSGLRMAWPFVQKILPLLDGQIITAVSNLLAPHPQHYPPAAPVNLAPIEQSLTGLQARQDELRDQVAEQNASFKRVEDRLEMVREATDRNTLEQQELMDDLKKVGRKVNIVAVLALLLLAGSVAVNVVLYLHIRRVLP